ncbi:MAG: TetR/AcrR family transcriptional regulator [Oscillospiraceae bacterium]|nr:TetR/AcrR family transcriptional regulator [Oscillospiraceae bacterium]
MPSGSSANERNRLTRESLQEALIYLMNEMPFDKITVTALVTRAGVSRMAFYRNYNSIEAILTELTDFIKSIFFEMLSSLKREEDIYNMFLFFFDSVRQNERMIRLVVSAEFPSDFNVNTSISEAFIKPSDEKESLQIAAYEGAVSGVITKWFVDGMKLSSEFMAKYCTEISTDVLKRVIEANKAAIH